MGSFPDRAMCKRTSLPGSLTGKTVLDVGGHDGYMAAECLRRGAIGGAVVDNGQYRLYQGYREAEHGTPYLVQVSSDIMDYHETAAIVLCFDVLYHVKSPYLLLEHLWELTEEVLCLSTRYVAGRGTQFNLYRPWEVHPDPTVYWKPTLPGLRKLVRIVGFREDALTYVEKPGAYEADGLVVGRWLK